MVALDEIRRVRRAVGLVDGLHDARKRIAAEALDALSDAVKDREQAAELAAFGERVQAAAEAGWNACRARNPRFDRSNGVRGNEIHSFQDLPHKLKVQYLTFAQGAFGALEAEAPDDAPAEGSDVVFMRGDRVQITGPAVAYMDASPNRELSEGEVVTIIRGVEDSDGDVLVEKSNGNWTYVRKSSLIPYVPLQVNQRVRVTGPRISCYDDTPVTNLEDGEVVTLIRATPDHDGDVRVRKADGRWTYIRATSLTPVSEGESVEAEARPAESAFQKGDRAIVARTPVWGSRSEESNIIHLGEVVEVRTAEPDDDGDLMVKSSTGRLEYVRAECLAPYGVPQFEVGDRVRITGLVQTVEGRPRTGYASVGEYGRVIVRTDLAGDARIVTDRGRSFWIAARSLTRVDDESPRTWDSLVDVPADVHKVKDAGDYTYTREGDQWHCSTCGPIDPTVHVGDGPYSEVVDD